jgi:hypothetical protein
MDIISFITPHGPLGLAHVTASPTIGAAATIVFHSSGVKSDLLAIEIPSSFTISMRRAYTRSNTVGEFSRVFARLTWFGSVGGLNEKQAARAAQVCSGESNPAGICHVVGAGEAGEIFSTAF